MFNLSTIGILHVIIFNYYIGCNELHWFPSQIKTDNFTCVKVNHYRSRYGLQHGALAYTEQQANAVSGRTHCEPENAFFWNCLFKF